jgi:hypothetical protein
MASGTKHLFGRIASSKFNTCVAPIMGSSRWEFWRYAEGFKIVADNAVQNLCPSRNNLVGFPVGYLYRHSLELMIKGLILQVKAVLNEEGSYEQGHKLETAWRACRPLLEKAAPEWPRSSFDKIEECVKAFSSTDFDGEFFRYPEDRSGWTWQQPVEYLNVAKMRDAFSDASEILDSLYHQMHAVLEHRALSEA